MVSLLQKNLLYDPQLYPESDGKPMAENTKQYSWIVILKENLEILFKAVPLVFIAADLLWYPFPRAEGEKAKCQAPDVMVVFGRPKGPRGSYCQWVEEQIGPQVVFEILSPGNKTPKGRREMRKKFRFYQTYGVEEYYIYDPDTFVLRGWLRQGSKLIAIPRLTDWISPRLGIRFRPLRGQDLEVYDPNGRKFLTSVELDERAEQQRQRAEQEQQRAEQEQQRAEQERQRAEQQQQRAEQAEAQLRLVVLNLLRQGMDSQQVADLVGLSMAQIEAMQL